MKYRRLKTLGSNGHPTLRYYKLADDAEALCNVFYGLEDGVASKIEGEVGEGVTLIGFSHGGGNLYKKHMLLDINENVVYMGILGEGEDDRPAVGEIVNGFQKVIDTHYDGDEGMTRGDWGVETLDNPYYLFVIVQPAGTDYASEIDDSDAGEESGEAYPVDPGRDPEPIWDWVVSFNSNGGSEVPAQYVADGEKATEPTDPTKDGYTFAGWYSDAGLTTEFDFTASITADVTAYAKWTEE